MLSTDEQLHGAFSSTVADYNLDYKSVLQSSTVVNGFELQMPAGS